jgi:fatty acid desaturase
MMRISTKSADATLQRDMRLFRELRCMIRESGCMQPAPFAIGIHMLVTLSIYFSAFAVFLNDPQRPMRLLMLIAIAFASVQAGYIAHEVGHLSFSRNAAVSRFLAHVFLTFVSGYGHSVYKEKHNSHHAHINEDEKDPDVSGGGLFTFYKGAAKSKSGIARWFTAHQRVLVWFLYGLIPFASKKDSVIRYVGGGRSTTRTGQSMLALHFLLWFSLPVVTLGIADALINFFLAGWLMGPYLGCVILLNHIGTRHLPADHGMSHFRRATLTTRNFESGVISSYLTGGTNNHLEHHLFPTVPICRLGKARLITQRFCHENALPYQETTWLAAQKNTLAHLAEMSRHAKTVWEKQAAIL